MIGRHVSAKGKGQDVQHEGSARERVQSKDERTRWERDEARLLLTPQLRLADAKVKGGQLMRETLDSHCKQQVKFPCI